VFDPLGFAVPVILVAKLLLQELCRRKYDWNEPMMMDCDYELWQQWLDDLTHLSEISIPRCFNISKYPYSEFVDCQLHHFSDASSKGYGVVSYLRLVTGDGQVFCNFVIGDPGQWRYVDSQSNPADDASRGLSIKELAPRWLQGPGFLKKSEEQWTVTPINFPELPSEFNVLKSNINTITVIKAVAWILRIKAKWRKRDPIQGPFTVDELQAAEYAIFGSIQWNAFSQEMNLLSKDSGDASSRLGARSSLAYDVPQWISIQSIQLFFLLLHTLRDWLWKIITKNGSFWNGAHLDVNRTAFLDYSRSNNGA